MSFVTSRRLFQNFVPLANLQLFSEYHRVEISCPISEECDIGNKNNSKIKRSPVHNNFNVNSKSVFLLVVESIKK